MTARRRFYEAFGRLAGLGEGLSRGLLYLGVGTLRLADFHEIQHRSASTFARSDAEVVSGLNPWERSTYGRFVARGDRLCVVGCGSGRDLLPWIDLGHEAVGIEPSSQPVATLRRILDERGQRATIIESTVEDAELPGQFDVVLFTYNCYSLIPGTQRRISVLRKLAGALTPEGRICFSYAARTGSWENRSGRLARLSATLTRSDWRVEPYDAFRRTTVDGAVGLAFEHYFVADEVEDEVARAGLRILVHEREPWRTFVVLER